MGIEAASKEKASPQQNQAPQQQQVQQVQSGINQSPVISYAKMTASPAIQFGTVPSPNPSQVPVTKIGTVQIMTAASPSTTTSTSLPLPPRTHSAPPEAVLIQQQSQQVQQPPKHQQPQQQQQVKEKKSALPVNAAPYEPSVPFTANPMVMFGAPPVQAAAPYYYAAPAFGVPTPLVVPSPVIATAPVVTPAVAATPVIAQPPVKKPIRIRDPNTNQDISLVPVSKPITNPVSTSAAPAVILVTTATTTTVESSPASSVQSVASSTSKRGISIIDPKSGKPVELGKISSNKPQPEEQPATPKLLEESLSNLSLTEPTPQVAPLDVDVQEAEQDSDESEEEEEEFSGLIRPGMKVFYPARVIPYEAPKTPQDIWRYARSFLLQFMTICTQKPDKAAEMARIAAHQQHRRSERHHERGRKPPKKVYSEAELQAYAQMLSRAENAWTPVADASTLAEEERIIREVKGILNKLTADKFDTLTKQVEDLGITSANVLSGVIDVIFEKATMEPKFAEMYAAFCIRIVQHEVNVLLQTNAQATAMDSLFRRMLIEKCQKEYQNKRAWSEERMQLAAQGIHVKSIASGDLSEQDYAMIRRKRAVLGNIRFIGELFKVKLIGPRIMHACLQEMLTNVEEPEEDEVECVCRLFSTVNLMLEGSAQGLKDEAEKREFIAKMVMYRERLGVLSKHPKLCSRVRFMVMDVLDAMKKQQQPQPQAAVPRPPTNPPNTSSASNTNTTSKLHVKSRRQSDRDGGSSAKPMQPAEQDASGWNTTTQRKPSGDGWSTSGSSTTNSSSSHTSRGRPSSASPQPTKVFSTTTAAGNRRSAAASPAPVVPERVNTPSSTNSMNRFDALEDVAAQSPPQSPTIAPTAVPVPSIQVTSCDDEKKIKVFLSIYSGEYLSMKSVPALLEYFNEISGGEAKAQAVEQLILQAMEKHSRFEQWREFFVPVGQQLFPLLPGVALVSLLKRVFASAIELSMDIPLMTEYCGALIALVLVPTGVEHVTPLLPWQEDEMYAVKIFSAFLKYTPEREVVGVDGELLEVLKRYERVLERTAEKIPALESAFFTAHFSKSSFDSTSLRTLFTKYPNAARSHLETITHRLLSKPINHDGEEVMSEFVMMVSPLLDDRMQPQHWQAMVRGVSQVIKSSGVEGKDVGRRIRELQLIPEEYFEQQQN